MSREQSAMKRGKTFVNTMRSRALLSDRSLDRVALANMTPASPHGKGEWIGAEIELQTPLLAQYAMSHYLEQDRVMDADVE
jgi:hypothetical protein